jgi:hypothetical protein
MLLQTDEAGRHMHAPTIWLAAFVVNRRIMRGRTLESAHGSAVYWALAMVMGDAAEWDSVHATLDGVDQIAVLAHVHQLVELVRKTHS